MKKTALLFNVFLVGALFFGVNAKAVLAGPHLSLDPETNNYTVGQEFDVVVKLDPGGEQVGGADGKGTYDSNILELIRMEQSPSMVFGNSSGNLDVASDCDLNDARSPGLFSFSCNSNNHLDPDSQGGDLVIFKFKAKTTGTALVKFNCTTDSTADTNITRVDPVGDVIVCSENINGSYVIAAGSGSNEPTPTSSPNPSDSGESAQDEESGELLQTGGIGATLGLILFGAVSVVSAVFLKFL